MSIPPTSMELTHVFGVPQVLAASATATAAMAMIVGVSSSSLRGAEPLIKKARTRAFLPPSTRYMCVCGRLPLMQLVAPIFIPELKEDDFWVTRSVPQ
jgi:hypothetical protein